MHTSAVAFSILTCIARGFIRSSILSAQIKKDELSSYIYYSTDIFSLTLSKNSGNNLVFISLSLISTISSLSK